MNKQTNNKITIAKKVSAGEHQKSVIKTYHVSKSDKEHTAYVVKCEDFNDIPLELSGAKYEYTTILSARVVENNDQLDTFVSEGNFDIEEINIPAGVDRDAFLKKWFKIATKKKTNLLPLLLLPLTACGGAKDVTAPVVTKPVVTEKSTGVWEVGSNNGAIAVTKNTGNTEFTFTPTTGAAVDVAISGVNELQIPSGVTVNADAVVVSGKTINGAGTINITNVEDDLNVDLSTITTTNVNATVDSSTSIVFSATSHFGDATVTFTGNTSSTADVITFHSSANVSSATFVVSTGATLGLSLVQAAAISATDTITGTGNVVITMPEDTIDNTETALVKVDLEGGSLTFDQGTDDNDILVLAAGSSIDLAGGTLIIDDGTVDFITNAVGFSNVGNVIMNSGIMIPASVLIDNVSGTISGTGKLTLEVTSVDEISALDAKMASYISSSLEAPTLAVNVGDVSSFNSTQLSELNTALTNLAPKLSVATGKNVAVKDSTGQSIEQFTATVSGGQVIFAGEQKGDISVNVNADGSATFSRGTVKSDTTVSDLSAVDLDIPTSAELDISLSGDSAQNLFELNAQNATVINLIGNIDGEDEITVKINDANSSSLNSKDITIDTTGLSGTGSLVFEFDTTAKNIGQDDTVVLSSSSVISNSIGTLEVVNGHLDVTQAKLPDGLEIITASGITMTTDQFVAADSFTSLPGSGELTIVSDNTIDLATLNTFLTTQDTSGNLANGMTVIGHDITVRTDSGDVVLSSLSGSYATLKTNLEAISFPGIPQLSAAVESNDA
ncbi:hypothetical protein N8369_09950, partial [Amylibacter sp.]|nr:hypothetical protein [Amylibacter sp.]